MDYFNPDVVSAQDYYPFGMMMVGRVFSTNSTYRYGFNGQEKSIELTVDSYTAEYWQYDGRIGRRWNIDPVLKEHESPYMAFSGNPIWFSDPNGSDTTKPGKSTEQLLSESKAFLKDNSKAIDDTERDIETLKKLNKVLSQISKDIDKTVAENKALNDRTKEFIKNGNELIERTKQSDLDFQKRLAEIESQSFWEYINPVEDVDAYVSVQVKKTVTVTIAGQKISGTMVQYGLQGGYTTQNGEGFYGDFVTIDKSYVNYTIPGTNTEVRVIPANNALKLSIGGQATYGDFAPTFRVLTKVTNIRGVTIQTDFFNE